ncbi:UU173 family protein [Mycoplasmopsis gallinacea]|uniref:Domain of uncharacterized function(DUF2779) n=1 Tax=Mycoplasmopsis gallinacea TaxID=29556 RepID=A0A449A280_9BACT|nr:DUF2779 domain-containing protein [Mycoplasmopsis gallinacea]VEU58293.1 Domain of uncharacterised function(DUF2779) [Mycoplasmopsis gallinacea]
MNNKNIKINFKTFFRVFTDNPALIWIKGNFAERLENGEYSKKWPLDKSGVKYFANYKEHLEEEGEDEDDEDIFLGDFMDNDEGENLSIVNKVESDSFQKYVALAREFYIKKYGYKINEITDISSKNNAEAKWAQTKAAMENDAIKLISNPLFTYQKAVNGEIFDTNADAFFYDKQEQKIVFLNYTSFAKPKFFYKGFFTYNVLRKLNYNVKQISVININFFDNNITKNTTKDTCTFYESFSTWNSAAKVAKAKPRKKATAATTLEDEELFYALKNTGELRLFTETGSYYEGNKAQGSFFQSARFGKISPNPKEPTVIKTDYNKIDYTNYQETIINQLGEEVKIKFKDPNSTNIDKDENIYLDTFDKYLDCIINSYFEFGDNFNYDAIAYFFSVKESVEHLPYAIADLSYQKQISAPNNIVLPKKLFLDNQLEVNAIRKYIWGPDFEQISSKFFKAKSLQNLELYKNNKEFFESVPNYFNIHFLNYIRNLHIKDKRVIWYDYEGFSNVFPILDQSASYGQIVNQVSVIETVNGIEKKIENVVVDTKNITLKDLVMLIQTIYSNKADYYVVFNKTYENTRNKEIKELVRRAFKDNKDLEFINWFNSQYIDVSEFASHVDYINNNTIDLADCFSHNKLEKKAIFHEFHIGNEEGYFFFKTNENHQIELLSESYYAMIEKTDFLKTTLIHINFLKHFFSIKKIEKYITKNQFPLKTLITPYSELVIQKGTMAMEEAILRHAQITGDNVWKMEKEPELKRYCENDVRAMIMVYEFLMMLIRSAAPEIDKFEYQIESENFEYIYQDGKLDIISK